MNSQEKYGAYYKNVKGYFIKLGGEKYNHYFGGSGWKVIDKKIDFDGPSLLLTLDLNDPSLKKLKNPLLNELPLCSYLNCSVWEDEQVFQIVPENKEVHQIKKNVSSPEPAMDEDKLPNPLPRRSVHIEDIDPDEYPISEDLYWKACDNFLGGDGFIRLLQPLWLENVETQVCSCGKEMIFTCCIGYENHETKPDFIDGGPFFLGEAALYFFYCDRCLIVKSVCQSS